MDTTTTGMASTMSEHLIPARLAGPADLMTAEEDMAAAKTERQKTNEGVHLTTMPSALLVSAAKRPFLPEASEPTR
jgi:hypothetical protein